MLHCAYCMHTCVRANVCVNGSAAGVSVMQYEGIASMGLCNAFVVCRKRWGTVLHTLYRDTNAWLMILQEVTHTASVQLMRGVVLQLRWQPRYWGSTCRDIAVFSLCDCARTYSWYWSGSSTFSYFSAVETLQVWLLAYVLWCALLCFLGTTSAYLQL